MTGCLPEPLLQSCNHQHSINNSPEESVFFQLSICKVSSSVIGSQEDKHLRLWATPTALLTRSRVGEGGGVVKGNGGGWNFINITSNSELTSWHEHLHKQPTQLCYNLPAILLFAQFSTTGCEPVLYYTTQMLPWVDVRQKYKCGRNIF